MSDETPMRQCTKCKEWKPETTECFRWMKDVGRFRGTCKICQREQRHQYCSKNAEAIREKARQYRAENAEAIREQKRQYYVENTEELREMHRQYRAENTEQRREYSRQYRIENAEAIHQYQHQYRVENPGYNRQYRAENAEAIRAKDHRRRARLANAEGNHTASDIRLQYKAQRARCWWCECAIRDNPPNYHVDHLIPLAKGGSNAANNIVLACPDCNLSKHDKLPHEWIGRLF